MDFSSKREVSLAQSDMVSVFFLVEMEVTDEHVCVWFIITLISSALFVGIAQRCSRHLDASWGSVRSLVF